MSASDKRWGTLIAQKGRISVYHDLEVGPSQFNVVVWDRHGEVGSGSLACAIDNAEVIGNRDAAVPLTGPESDWLLGVQGVAA